jgi:hypothetical protein
MALGGTGRGGVLIMRKVVVFSVLFLILLLSSASMTFGQVQTRIRAIEASNVGSSIDPSLKDIHSDLGSLFNFTSYRLLRDETLNLVPNQPVLIQGRRHPGRFMEVTLVGQHRDNAQIRIRVIREGVDILNTQVRLSAGRTVLVGGPRRGEGVIIFAVSARF